MMGHIGALLSSFSIGVGVFVTRGKVVPCIRFCTATEVDTGKWLHVYLLCFFAGF